MYVISLPVYSNNEVPALGSVTLFLSIVNVNVKSSLFLVLFHAYLFFLLSDTVTLYSPALVSLLPVMV